MAFTKEQKELLAKARKQFGKQDKSLPILIQESDLYDWNHTARMILLVIALGQRTNEDAYVPEDMPDSYKDDMLGWCDMSQWRLSIRVGVTEDWVQKLLRRFREEGVIERRTWEDDNHTNHAMYRVIEKTVKDHQRPSQKPDVERPPRYKTKHTTPGAFKKGYDMRRANQEKAVAAGADDE